MVSISQISYRGLEVPSRRRRLEGVTIERLVEGEDLAVRPLERVGPLPPGAAVHRKKKKGRDQRAGSGSAHTDEQCASDT